MRKTDIPSDLTRIRFSMAMPKAKYIIQLSKKHPDTEFQIKSLVPLPNSEGNMLLEVQNPRKRELEDILGSLKLGRFKDKITILHISGDRLLAFIKIRNPTIMSVIISNSTMVRYPIVIKDGMGFFNLVGRRDRIDGILTEFEGKEMEFTIERIGKFQYRDFLTINQKEILRIAIKNGYYAIPRKISLTVFSKLLGISPSALSESLRRIHKKLVSNYIREINP